MGGEDDENDGMMKLLKMGKGERNGRAEGKNCGSGAEWLLY